MAEDNDESFDDFTFASFKDQNELFGGGEDYRRQCSDGGDVSEVAAEVARQETYGTLGAIVKSRTGNRQVTAVASILLTSPNGEKPRPIGIIWGGTANRGRLKLKVGQPPENWTSGVDLGRLLDLLELDLITSNESLQVALQVQINASAPGIGSAAGESSPAERIQLKDKADENFEPINLNIRQDPIDDEGGNKATPCIEHQFILSVSGTSLVRQKIQHGNGELKRLSVIRGSDEDMFVSLQLAEREPKRRKQ
ncbi:hypothetical protein RND71_033828 [Anisodus tanguticus]|uniref:Nal1 C-terminal domain-containing protein n=1 Tax=Anisodus tanguticus TaxID=243964 RepID=A0AAE1R8E6_9SOLA|nr:hypothetical protein RND71_033828 [Anisodus tanguticus]